MPRAHTLAGALAGQLNRNVMPTPAPVPGTYAGLVDAVGGTKAAAALLGISQREVQRQVAYDKASRGEPAAAQRRAPSPTQENKLATQVADAASAEAKAEGIQAVREAGGLSVHFEGEVVIGGSSHEHRRFDYDIDDEALDEPWEDDDGEARPSFYDALRSGNRADIAAAFNHAFFASQGGFPSGSALLEVDELDVGLLE